MKKLNFIFLSIIFVIGACSAESSSQILDKNNYSYGWEKNGIAYITSQQNQLKILPNKSEYDESDYKLQFDMNVGSDSSVSLGSYYPEHKMYKAIEEISSCEFYPLDKTEVGVCTPEEKDNAQKIYKEYSNFIKDSGLDEDELIEFANNK